MVSSIYINPWAVCALLIGFHEFWLSSVFTSSDWLSPLTSGDNLSAHVP